MRVFGSIQLAELSVGRVFVKRLVGYVYNVALYRI